MTLPLPGFTPAEAAALAADAESITPETAKAAIAVLNELIAGEQQQTPQTPTEGTGDDGAPAQGDAGQAQQDTAGDGATDHTGGPDAPETAPADTATPPAGDAPTGGGTKTPPVEATTTASSEVANHATPQVAPETLPWVDTPVNGTPPALTSDETKALLAFADEVAAAQSKLAVALYNAGKSS